MSWKNKREFERFFKDNYKHLCLYAFGFLKDMDASEEIVQDVFVNLWKKRKDISISTNPKSYIYTSVKNLCFNQIKHLKHVDSYMQYNHHNIQLQEQIESDVMVANEMQQKISDSINNMPTERKKIFLLSRNQGLKYREIADQLNISVKTVENQMGKALKYLRAELGEYMTIFIFVILFLLDGGKF